MAIEESAVIGREAKSSADCPTKPRDANYARGFVALDELVRFRPMTSDDIDHVMVIERTSYRFPWSLGFFLQELRVACARSILAEIDGRIIGYVLYWLLPGTVDVHNIAVHVDYRRRGLGRTLLNEVIAQAKGHSAQRMTLEVRKSNLVAQKLYESMGFFTSGTRKGYYSDDGEDALAMTLDLDAVR